MRCPSIYLRVLGQSLPQLGLMRSLRLGVSPIGFQYDCMSQFVSARVRYIEDRDAEKLMGDDERKQCKSIVDFAEPADEEAEAEAPFAKAGAKRRKQA